MRVTSTKRKALKLYGNRRSRRYEPQFHCGASHRTVLAYYCHAIAACRNCLVPSLGYSSFKSSQVKNAETMRIQKRTEHRPPSLSLSPCVSMFIPRNTSSLLCSTSKSRKNYLGLFIRLAGLARSARGTRSLTNRCRFGQTLGHSSRRSCRMWEHRCDSGQSAPSTGRLPWCN